MAPNKVIIDTDPGCDDILALLLALASSPEDVEVCLISVTYGNVDVQNCLRNLLSMFHVVEQEIAWRTANGLPAGFELLQRTKPRVAVGASKPLGKTTLMADYYHGADGLGGIHETHPHHTNPESAWKHLFDPPPADTVTATAKATATQPPSTHPPLFTPSHQPSSTEILNLLRSSPPNTVSLIALGPLTNYATAAAFDPTTFLRAKDVLVMGGALNIPGNITPVAEFNCIADPVAAARVYALTSPDPASTIPPPVIPSKGADAPLPNYPPSSTLGDDRLSIVLFPLDITTPHALTRGDVTAAAADLVKRGSPLAEWVSAFLEATFEKTESLYHGHGGDATSMALHDIVTVWYAVDRADPGWLVNAGVDVRVETQGQWTRGMHVVDRRGRQMLKDDVQKDLEVEAEVEDGEDRPGDTGHWLSRKKGNRIGICVGTPGETALAPLLMERIFGSR